MHTATPPTITAQSVQSFSSGKMEFISYRVRLSDMFASTAV